MSEQDNNKIDPPVSEAENLSGADAQETLPSEPYDEDELYEEGGFDPEQRRLLWTVAIVIILGMFAATWLSSITSDRRAARTLHGQELLADFNRQHNRFMQEQDQASKLLLNAMAQNDRQGVEGYMAALVEEFKKDREAAAALHHEEGLDDPPLSREAVNDYANGILNGVSDRLDQIRQARAAATRPSSSQPSPSPSPAPSTAPTGSPLLPPGSSPIPGGNP